jgi:hypothetical protein
MDEKPRRSFQVSLRTLLEIVAVIAFVLALMYARNAGNGRYQLLDKGQHQPLFLVDTRTGECWSGWSGGTWNKALGPVSDK